MDPALISRIKFTMVESMFDLKKIIINSSFISNWFNMVESMFDLKIQSFKLLTELEVTCEKS